MLISMRLASQDIVVKKKRYAYLVVGNLRNFQNSTRDLHSGSHAYMRGLLLSTLYYGFSQDLRLKVET